MFDTVSNPNRRKLLTATFRSLSTRARRNGSITTDDVHDVLDRQRFPRSASKRLSVIATLLNGAESVFINTGYTTPSTRPAAKGRRVYEWTYNA